MCWRRYPPLSISLPFLAVGALPMMTTCQRAIRGFLAALQPSQAGLSSIRSERCALNPAVPSANSELLIFNSLTCGDAVPRRDGLTHSTVTNDRRPILSLKPRGADVVVSRSLGLRWTVRPSSVQLA